MFVKNRKVGKDGKAGRSEGIGIPSRLPDLPILPDYF